LNISILEKQKGQSRFQNIISSSRSLKKELGRGCSKYAKPSHYPIPNTYLFLRQKGFTKSRKKQTKKFKNNEGNYVEKPDSGSGGGVVIKSGEGGGSVTVIVTGTASL